MQHPPKKRCKYTKKMRITRNMEKISYLCKSKKHHTMTTFNSIRGIFFSPTGSTREITEFATRQLASRWNLQAAKNANAAREFLKKYH